MENEWTIKPQQGLGELLFGMVPNQIATLSAIYGEPGPTVGGDDRTKAMENTIEQFGEFFTEEDIAALREGYGEASLPDSQTQVLSRDGTILDYTSKRLVEITVSTRNKRINFRDKLVFQLKSKEVLALFEAANKAPGRYGSTGAAFDNIAVYLDSFSVVRRDGTVEPMPETDERFHERTIGLREKPYTPEEMLPDYAAQSFL